MTDEGVVQNTMQVLVVGTEAWAIDRAVRALRQAGHQVVRCPAAEEMGAECAVLDGAWCGLDRHLDVVIVVRAHPLDRVVRSEQGAVCALRRGVPLVLVGAGATSPFAPFAAASVDLDADVVSVCADVTRSPVIEPSAAAIDQLELLVRRRPLALAAPRRHEVAVAVHR